MSTSEALEVIPASPVREVLLSPVMNLATAKSRLATFQEFVQGYLQESKNGGQDGGDYGSIPGAGSKKVLLKSGADKLCELYGLYDEYEVESEEDFDTSLFYYKVKCILKSRRDDSTVGTGLGSCSTFESKYRWRDSQRKCPTCTKETIIKGKEEFGGGWLCWGKKGGCGAKFKDGDEKIEKQTIGRVENPDILDTVNTVLKMAKKRAKIDAVIGVTRSSGIFTQDMEDVVTEAKPVAVTTQDIPLPKNSPGDVKGNAGTQAVAEKPAVPGEDKTTIENDPGMVANFARAFKEALPKHLQKNESELRHEWLGTNFFLDKDGNPSHKVILKSEFEDWKAKACEWARAKK